MALTEKQIRTRILEAIWEICPESKRIYRNNLTGDRTKWAGLFRIDSDDDDPIAFAFIVRRAGYKKNESLRTDKMTFEILGFRSFDIGTDADNSEDKFQTVIDEIADRLADKDVENPLWGFADEEDEAATKEVEFGKIGLIQSSELLHFGGGRIAVNIHRC